MDLSKGLVSVKEYFDSDKKKCFNAADYDSKANKFCCFHLYKLIENPTFGDQMISILWNGAIMYLEYPINAKKKCPKAVNKTTTAFSIFFIQTRQFFFRAL